MAEDWAAIRAEVSAAIDSVGFDAILEMPGTPGGTTWAPTPGTPTQTTVRVVDEQWRGRDANGALTEEVEHVLLMQATVTPTKAGRVRLRGRWHQIVSVASVSPGGVDLMHEVMIAD
jgi:hypothetical protein